MTDKQIIFNCDVDCIKKNTEKCFKLDCIYGQRSILKQLSRKEQECEELKDINAELDVDLQNARDSYVALDLMRVGEYNALVDDYNKLKQALTEIKEEVYLLNDRTMVRKDICDRLDLILQKCEVLDE